MSIRNGRAKKTAITMIGIVLLIATTVFSVCAFEPLKGDMATFDPNNQTFPTSGDTINVGIFDAFSGPAALSGEVYSIAVGWVVHDINAQGGILVDGKKKKIKIVRGDTQAKPAIAKKVAERLCLEDKVHMMCGTSGSHIGLIGQQVAAKYKTIYLNYAGFSKALHDASNFNRYTFRCCWQTDTEGAAMAYFFSKRPERKFYILNQDYGYGHIVAESFKKYLKKYKPEAEIVGEAYHPLFMKDFAPYLTKVQGTGAEIIFSTNWPPDGDNLMKQAKELGISAQLAGLYFDNYSPLETIGGPKGKGIINLFFHLACVDTPENNRFNEIWTKQWKSWAKPYDSPLYRWPTASVGGAVLACYWFFDVMQRAASTNPEKIITVWEGDEYESFTGKATMRACDHQQIKDVYVSVLDYPTKWYENSAGYTKAFIVPAEFCTPELPEGLERCNKK